VKYLLFCFILAALTGEGKCWSWCSELADCNPVWHYCRAELMHFRRVHWEVMTLWSDGFVCVCLHKRDNEGQESVCLYMDNCSVMLQTSKNHKW